MIKIGILGAFGKMGLVIQEVLQSWERDCVLFGVDSAPQAKSTETLTLLPSTEEMLSTCDIIIDFSHPDASLHLCEKNMHTKKPLIIGTTGFDPTILESYTSTFPIFYSSNYSIGIFVLQKLLDHLQPWLQKFPSDILLVESHHTQKKDAPSGTAKTLQNRLASNGIKLSTDPISLREGGVIGKHTLHVTGQFDQIILEHTAWDRRAFVFIIQEVIPFLLKKQSGFFSLEDLFPENEDR